MSLFSFAVKQKAIHELRVHCWKRGNKRGIEPLLYSFPSATRPNFPFNLQSFVLTQVLHYVEKPSTFVSDIINCGIYLFNPDIFQHIGSVFQKNQQDMLLWVEALFLWGWGGGGVSLMRVSTTHFLSLVVFICPFSSSLVIFVSSHHRQISVWWVSWYIWAARHSWRALSEWCEL